MSPFFIAQNLLSPHRCGPLPCDTTIYQAAEKLCRLPRAENCPTINAVLSRVLNELFELAYHMPNAAETVEAPYTAAEHLTFLPQPAIGFFPAWRKRYIDFLSVFTVLSDHR